jgi:hypothetical protein
MTIGYKVVSKHKGRPYSFSFRAGGIRYRTDYFVKPKKGCGPLAVFADMRHADLFAEEFGFEGSWNIYECEYVASPDTCLWNLRHRSYTFPDGTVFASKVKLLKRIK